MDIQEGDVVKVTYVNDTTGKETEMKVGVTDTDDKYMTEGEGEDGFKGKRLQDDKEVGVWPDGPVCTFGYKQSFIGSDAEVEIVLEY